MGENKMKSKQGRENFIFVFPALILVAVVFYIPFFMSGYYSLTKWDGIAKNRSSSDSTTLFRFLRRIRPF